MLTEYPYVWPNYTTEVLPCNLWSKKTEAETRYFVKQTWDSLMEDCMFNSLVIT